MKTFAEKLNMIFSELGFSVEEISKANSDLNNLIKAVTIQKLLNKADEETKNQVAVLMKDNLDQEKVSLILKGIFSDKDFENEQRVASKDVLTNYIESLISQADEDKRQKIVDMLVE